MNVAGSSNFKDDCLFPALSKHVTWEQGVSKGNQIFMPDELWQAVEKCWKAFLLDTLSHAYVRHAQIASAIASCSGGDKFVRERGGLHCNVRNCCVTVCNQEGKPIGLKMALSYDIEEDDELTQQQQQLRYKQSTINQSNLEEHLQRMTADKLEVLFNGIPITHPWFNSIVDAFSALESE